MKKYSAILFFSLITLSIAGTGGEMDGLWIISYSGNSYEIKFDMFNLKFIGKYTDY